MSKISIWSPTNQQDFCLKGVTYTGNELRLRALLKINIARFNSIMRNSHNCDIVKMFKELWDKYNVTLQLFWNDEKQNNEIFYNNFWDLTHYENVTILSF